ncbi:MAG: GNAT family N-acetyltransferase [Candidatus Andeanibacterium colombiense]|uniref:GNAT family N-acetyltransferase n=1 Tax=Candidatus Andeanibacterium colombiense TaxID=3121345 RepID=A0AAJ6BLP7_9SPHN|nr:MAG: GNAT family N-acetyltransferase [Sphingomonadaceae bacterium]
MTLEPVIRPATSADAPALEVLVRQLGYDERAADIAARLAALEQAGLVTLVAELDDRVVGCLTSSIMPVLHRPKPVGRISMMVVLEDLRGQRIGERLVRAAEAWLKQQGCGMIEVTSNVQRTDAHRFYERIGYEKTSWRFAVDGDKQ